MRAFAKLPPGALDALIANPAKLKAVLTYHHVVAGKVAGGGCEARNGGDSRRR